MRVYRATVIDKCASPSGEDPASYESYIAVLDNSEQQYDVYAMDRETDKYIMAELEKHGLTDEDIHCYFYEDEFAVGDENTQGKEVEMGETIETEEFKYLVGERIA